MLESLFTYNKRGPFPSTSGKASLLCYTYTFKVNSGNKYVFVAEYSPEAPNLFIVKFYAKVHKSHRNKYNMRTNAHEVFRVVSGCLHIMETDLLANNPNASFLFVGASDNIETDPNPTKRFKVWLKFLARKFKKPKFLPAPKPEISTCIFINGKISQEEKKAIDAFLIKNMEYFRPDAEE